MTFGAPEWFWGFLLLPVLGAVFLRTEALRVALLGKLVAARLLPELAAAVSPARRRFRFALALLGLACVILALAQPRLGYTIEERPHSGLDVMIAIDTSKSMLSTDVQPSRLARAKFAAEDLLDALAGNRVGLIAFAGTAFVQAPLTIDDSAVLASIQDLDTNTIPRGGTDIATAIRTAADAFGKGESSQRALILFSDGEELEENAVEAAREAKGQFRIFTVGVGTKEGSLISVPDDAGGTGFVKDAQGQFVKSHLDEDRLRQIAEATGGFYVHLDNGPATVKAIVQQGLSKMTQHQFQGREMRPIERYEWPLGAGMLLLIASMLIGERKRVRERATAPQPARAAVAAAVAAALLIFFPLCGWGKNEGVDLYDQQNYKGAYDVFQRQLERNPSSGALHFDEGTAAYKAGDYDRALEAFGKAAASDDPALRSEAEYNLGNTLVEQGALKQEKQAKIKELTGALQHYDQALKVDPKSADAKYNQEVVRKMLEELNRKPSPTPTPPPQQQQQQQKNQQQQHQQNQNQQQQQNNSQQKQQNQQQQQQQQNQQQQNQQGQSQQNQQAQNQQNQQQQGQGQQQQQQPQNQGQSQNQSQQPSPNGQPQQQQQPQQGQGGEPQNQQQQQQQNGGSGQQQHPQQQQGQEGEPSPTPGEGTAQQQPNPAAGSPTPALSGEIKAQPSQQDQQASEQADARAAATESARPGEMTPSQARALIDSLRGEDEHVSLSGSSQPLEPTFKDW